MLHRYIRFRRRWIVYKNQFIFESFDRIYRLEKCSLELLESFSSILSWKSFVSTREINYRSLVRFFSWIKEKKNDKKNNKRMDNDQNGIMGHHRRKFRRVCSFRYLPGRTGTTVGAAVTVLWFREVGQLSRCTEPRRFIASTKRTRKYTFRLLSLYTIYSIYKRYVLKINQTSRTNFYFFLNIFLLLFFFYSFFIH